MLSLKEILLEINKKDAYKITKDIHDIHNNASKEYKEAFKKVGAKMWPMDYAHEFKEKHTIASANNLIKFPNLLSSTTIPRPLTVLDKYPHIVRNNKLMKQLNSDVDNICKKYNVILKKYIKLL